MRQEAGKIVNTLHHIGYGDQWETSEKQVESIAKA